MAIFLRLNLNLFSLAEVDEQGFRDLTHYLVQDKAFIVG